MRIDRQLGLAAHLREDNVVGIGLNAPGVHQGYSAVSPLAFAVNAVAGDTGVSSTMESLYPTNLLKSVDLPTFGRPTPLLQASPFSFTSYHRFQKNAFRSLGTAQRGAPTAFLQLSPGHVVEESLSLVPEGTGGAAAVPSQSARRELIHQIPPGQQTGDGDPFPEKPVLHRNGSPLLGAGIRSFARKSSFSMSRAAAATPVAP